MNKTILIKCPDGFINQLRLSLAANFLVSIGEAQAAQQEWIINNHNNVRFDKFFFPFRYLYHLQPTDKPINNDPIITQSFSNMVKEFNAKDIIRLAYKKLKYKPMPVQLFESYIKENNINQCIGVHLRTGCKTALLEQDKNRHPPIDEKSIIDTLLSKTESIFLATDNAETQNKWFKIFQDRLHVYQTIHNGKSKFHGPYNRSNVTRYTTDLHTVADFYILQKCKVFIGSNESSFSIMINWLRNNPTDSEIKGIL